MAYTEFLVGDPRAQTQWDKRMMMPWFQPRPLTQFIGDEGSDMPITMKRQLVDAPGKQITMQQAVALSNVGIGNNGDLEGNEEAGVINNMNVTVGERGNAVKAQAKYSLQITDTNRAKFLKLYNNLLRQWGLTQVENDLSYCLSGLGNQNTYVGEGSSDITTVNEKAPSTNRVFHGGQNSSGTVEIVDALNDIDSTSANLFGIELIQYMNAQMKMMNPGIEPIQFADGRYLWPWLIHPLQEYQLRQQTNFKSYANSAKDLRMNPITGAMQFGTPGLKPAERPVAGAIAVIGDFVIIPWAGCQDRVAGESFDSSTDLVNVAITDGTYRVARSLILGQNAAFVAQGQPWKLYMKDFDYGRKPGVGTDTLYGVAKGCTRHPVTGTYGDDIGVCCVDTAVVG